ncbi:MAG: glycosyltransferase [Spirochaetota bacterium]|nr:glycosyltransferase [Spirochaetota bacterium]
MDMEEEIVLLVVTSLRIGGQERVAIETAKGLSSRYQVEIVAFFQDDDQFDAPVPVHYLGVNRSTNRLSKTIGQLRRIWKLAKIRKAKKVAFVYSFGSSTNITNTFSGLFSPGRVVTSIHEFTTVRKHVLDGFVYRHSDAVICISEAMKVAVDALYPTLTNTTVINNGYDIDEIIDKSNAATPSPIPSYQFVSLGRLEPVKGFDRLLKAFALVKQEIPDASLALIGGGSMEDELKELASSLNIQESIHFLGMHKNPFPYLKRAEIFVMSSRNEGFPSVLIEALSCSLGCISIDCNVGPREILSRTFTRSSIKGMHFASYGVLCEEHADEEQTITLLAEAMVKLARDENLLSEYQEKGIQRARDFSLDVYRQKIIHLFEKIKQ